MKYKYVSAKMYVVSSHNKRCLLLKYKSLLLKQEVNSVSVQFLQNTRFFVFHALSFLPFYMIFTVCFKDQYMHVYIHSLCFYFPRLSSVCLGQKRHSWILDMFTHAWHWNRILILILVLFYCFNSNLYLSWWILSLESCSARFTAWAWWRHPCPHSRV